MTAMLIAAMLLSVPMTFGKANFRVLAEGAGAAAAEAAEAKLLEKIQKKLEEALSKLDSEGMTKAQKDKFEKSIEKLNTDIAKLSEEAIAKLKLSVEEMATKNESLVTDIKKANDALAAQSIEIKKLKEGGVESTEQRMTFRDAMKAAIMENRDKLGIVERNDDFGKRLSFKGFFEKNGNRALMPEIEITKAAIDMFQSTNLDANVVGLRLTAIDPTRVSIPLSVYPHVMNVYQVKSIARPYMALLVVHTYWDGVAVKAEGAAAGKSSFKFKTVSFPAFYISTKFNLSDETLDDLDETLDEISRTAPDYIMKAIDAQIDRDGGDDVNSIQGILVGAAKCTDYVRQQAAASIPGATVVDLVQDMILQAEAAGYIPNVLKLNPKQIAKVASARNSFDDSKNDRRVTYDTLGQPAAICGLRIIKSTDIALDDALVLDNMLPWIGVRKGITMEIGYNGTDFEEGQKTVMFKVRLAFGVRDKAGVIYVNGVQAAVDALSV